MNIKILSKKIYEKIGKKSNFSESFINFFLESKVRKINELLNTHLTIKSDFTNEIAEIFEKLFDVYYYENGEKLNKNMIFNNDKESIKKINRNAVSKTYLIARLQVIRDLKILINSYKLKQNYVE